MSSLEIDEVASKELWGPHPNVDVPDQAYLFWPPGKEMG